MEEEETGEEEYGKGTKGRWVDVERQMNTVQAA